VNGPALNSAEYQHFHCATTERSVRLNTNMGEADLLDPAKETE